MAVAVDGASSAQTAGVDVNTLSWTSHTIAGADRLLVVNVSIEETVESVLSVTYGLAALTFKGSQAGAGSFAKIETWFLIAPATGTGTILITLAAAGLSDMVGGAVSFTGVHQTTPLGAFFGATATSTAPSVTVTDGVSGDMIIDGVAVDSGTQTATVGAGQTERWNRLISGNVMGLGSTEAGAASVVMDWSLSVSRVWAAGAVAVKAAAGAAANALLLRLQTEGLVVGGGGLH